MINNEIKEGVQVRAVVKPQKKYELILADVELPNLKDDEVLVKVKVCGVCGSDLHAYAQSKGYEFINPPRILGHEISGRVAKAGSELNETLIGSNIIIESMQYCGDCENCLAGRTSICESNKVIGLHYDGGMAEYVKTKIQYIKTVPNSLSLRIAALSEPMSIAIHAVNKIKNLNSNSHVLVQGPGIIGLFVGMVCNSKGAKVTLSGLESDYEHRLKRAKDFGMDIHVVDKEKLEKDMDIIVECSGSVKAFENSFSSLKKGGQVIVVALYENPVNLFLTDLVRNEWDIITSYGCSPQDYDEAFEILKTNKKELGELVDFYALESAKQAFQDSLSKKVLKALLVI